MDSNNSVHYAEHSVVKKYEGKYGKMHSLAIALFIIGPLLVLIGMLALVGAGAFIWFVPLSPTAILICKRGIYDRYFGSEYIYKIAGGVFTLTRHHDGRYVREIMNFTVSKAEFILPYRDEHIQTINSAKYDKRIEAVSSMKGDDVYAILIDDSKGAKTLLFIDGISKAVKLMSLYNKNTVVVQTKY